MKIEINQPFAVNTHVHSYDVRQLKKALNQLGYYQPYEDIGITDTTNTAIFNALKAFQKDYDLPITGVAKPDDDTIQTLNREIDKTPDGHYIWRTVEDRKVRASHAAFNCTIRSWNNYLTNRA